MTAAPPISNSRRGADPLHSLLICDLLYSAVTFVSVATVELTARQGLNSRSLKKHVEQHQPRSQAAWRRRRIRSSRRCRCGPRSR